MTALFELVGDSEAILELREQMRRVLGALGSRRPPPVLIQGETGTGKGLLASILHRSGPRAGGRFVAVNCAAIPETLLEAEMFGFERGAFTDAYQRKPGLLTTAHGGTLFLDEVGLLPEALQGKLLTAIEDREVRRIGSTRREPVDVWVVAATSEDLAAARREGRFQEALYQRLTVLTFRLPTLRERGRDIILLAERFLAQACADYGLAPKRLDISAERALVAYTWPGNVRELANLMERAALLCAEPVIAAEHLDLTEPRLSSGQEAGAARRSTAAPPEDARHRPEPADLLALLRETGWNVSRAAAQLGIPRNTLRYRIEKYGLRPNAPWPQPRPPAPTPAVAAPVRLDIPAPASGRWDQRRVTLLRATLAEPAETGVLDRHELLDLVVGKVGGFGGRLEEISTTGIVAAFGLDPVAEDAPRRAAHAALAIQRAVERARTPEAPAEVRLGIHVGEFVVGQAGGVPEIVLEGKREAWAVLDALVEAAAPGAIIASRAAVPFLEVGFVLTPAGVEGSPASARRLTGISPLGLESGRRLARFVGRADELGFLASQLAAAMRGLGHVVGIVGEPGIGKSRLLAEFRQRLSPERVAYLEAHCLSYGSAIPYLPLIDLLRRDCDIAESDRPEEMSAKVRRRLEEGRLDVAENAPYLLHLLGVKEGTDELGLVSPEAIQARTFDLLSQLSLRASCRRTLVLVFENLNWIDTASEEYLITLIDSLAGAPILLLLTYRPGFRPPWIDKSYVAQLSLQPLATTDSLAIVHSVLQTTALPAPVSELILERAEGNPFFLEELALALREHPPEDPPSVAVPATVQDVVLARIRRLAEEPMAVLQTAAVLGRDVPLRLLRSVWKGARNLDASLRELTRLEFLYEQSGTDERTYAFKHAVTREVAYASLLPARRRDLHAAAGRALETLYADRLGEVTDRLAHHYAQAEDAPKAVFYLGRAGARAARSYAHVEAVAALREAADHAERLTAPERDRRLLELAFQEAHSLYFLGRFSESLERLRRHAARVEACGDSALAGAYYFWLGHTLSHLGDHAEADRSAERAVAEATRCGDTATLGQAGYVRARAGFWSGRFAEGVAHAREAVTPLARAGEQWWLGLAQWGLAFSLGFMGDFGQALEAAARARAIGEAIEDPRLQAYAAWTTGWIRAARGEWDAGIEACQQSLARSPDPVNTADAQSFLGGAYLERGDAPRAAAALEQAVSQWRQFQHGPMLGWFTTLLGEAYLLTEHAERGREVVREGLEIARRVGFPFAVAWGERVLGRLARAETRLPDATRHLQAALETFAATGARFETGRTHLDLAELAHARGEPAEASRHLAEAAHFFAGCPAPRHLERARRLGTALGLPPVPSPAV
jgi:DNA-binding NtrC family response regulator/tetratricopeptide (TPR) repeat protein